MPRKIWFADLLRGIAALCVTVSHVSWPLWPVPQHLPLAMALLGQFGVGLFFLISGFLIPVSLMRGGAASFLAGRVWRIWPTYAAGFTLSLILLLRFGPAPTLMDTLGHYLLVQDILGTRSYDGVIWTLQIELKFYLLCACCAPLLRRLSPVLVLVAGATLCFGLFAPNGIWAQEACWLALIFIGVLYHAHQRGRLSAAAAVPLGAALAALFVYAWFTRIGGHRPWLLLAYGAAQLAFLACYSAQRRIGPHTILGWLSAISYPLYVVHVVLAGAVASRVLAAGGSAWLASGLALLASLLVAAVLHITVERPTHRLGQRRRAAKLQPAAASRGDATGAMARNG